MRRTFVIAPVLFAVACAVGSTSSDAPADGTGAPGAGSPSGDDASTLPPPGDDAGNDAATPGADAATPPDAAADAAKPDAAPDAPPTFACATTIDFESGAAGFDHGQIDPPSSDGWPRDSWAYGAAANGLGCHSGTKCFATNLTGNYIQCQRAALVSPALDLSTCASASSVKLVFQHAYAFWTGSYGGTTWYDGGIVEISGDGGQTWQAAPGLPTSGTVAINPYQGSYECTSSSSFYVDGKPGFVQASTGWQKVEIAIPAALRTAQFKVRFAYSSGVSSKTTDPNTSENHTAAGWHVDDVQVVAQ